ncbi:MAG: ABC transporter substrate-binding protein, partial [Ardenticatenaceae bacterium]
MLKLRAFKLLLGAAISLALVVALACGGDEEATPIPQATGTTEPPAGGTPELAATGAPVASPTTAAASSELPESESPEGTVIMAELSQALTGAAGSLPDLQMFPARQWGVGESLFTPSDVEWGTGMLAESWQLAPDNSEVTIQLRRGVQFHKEWGEFKAEDMAWVINRTNPTLNPESIASSAANFSALFGENEIEVIDDYTIKATFNTFDVRWASNLLSQEASGGLTSIATPKRAFDEMGRDWLRDNFIGTGPLQVVEHRVDIGGTYEKVPYD